MFFKSKKLLALLSIVYSTNSLLSVGLKEGTLVRTERGHVAIENIKIGDRVISYNFDRQEPESDCVVDLFNINNAKLLSFSALSVLATVAHDHKFFSPSKRAWTKAEDFEPSDTVQTFSGNPVTLETLTPEQQECVLHCLTVNKNHNFYVSEKDILVHNMILTLPYLGEIALTGGLIIGGIVLGKKPSYHDVERLNRYNSVKKNGDQYPNSVPITEIVNSGDGWLSQFFVRPSNTSSLNQFEKDRQTAKRNTTVAPNLQENEEDRFKPEPSITERSFDEGHVKRIHGGYVITTNDGRKIVRKTSEWSYGNEQLKSEIEFLSNNKGVIEKTGVNIAGDTITFNTAKKYTVEEWKGKVQKEEQERREKRGYLGSIGYTLGIGQDAAKWRQDERSRRSTLPSHATQFSQLQKQDLESNSRAIVEPATYDPKAFSIFIDKIKAKEAALFKQKQKNKKPSTVTPSPGKAIDSKPGMDDAQAPGIPTDKDGYRPPKKWDGKKRKHPETGQYGYPDNKGKIWVPSGPAGHPLAHGGPHWDVIDKDGNHDNVLPGGKIRGEKCEALNNKSLSEN